jgi:hypothetical protein
MTTIATRINNSGMYFVNGSFDEITTSTIRTTTNTVYASLLDEVTYNTTSPVIKNLIQYTEQLDNAYWVLTNGLLPVTANATIAPNGTLTADKITENTATFTNHYFQSTSLLISSSTQYTWSIYAKAGERTFIDLALGTASFWVNSARSATFNLTTGAVVSMQGAPLVASITSAGSGWYRCSITATSSSTSGMSSNGQIRLCDGSASNIYTGDGVSGAYFWGAQLEQNSTATIYQGIAATNTLVAPGFVKREASDGSQYITGSFDEVTGMIATNGLLAYYDAGKAASQPATGADWLDISNNRINATPSGTPTYNTAGYFTFDRVSSHRYLTTALNPTTWAEPWTIEVWMYTPTGAVWGNGVNRSHHISKGSTAGTWGVIRATNDNTMATWVRGAAEQAETSWVTLARDRWHQFVGTWDGVNTVSSYLNGEFVASSTITPTGAPDTGSLVIGGGTATVSGSPGTYYEGNIAAVMLYNRALSLDEVTNNFEALRDRFGI